LPPCVVHSEVKAQAFGDKEVRLGLESVRGVGTVAGQRIVAARKAKAFRDITDVLVRAQLDKKRAQCLAEAGAFFALERTRRQALWELEAVDSSALAPAPLSQSSPLAELTFAERTLADYRAMGLTVGPHLVAMLRPHLEDDGVTPAHRVLAQRN